MIKQTVVHLYYGILLSNEKKRTTHIHKNLHNPQGDYAIKKKKKEMEIEWLPELAVLE